MSGDLALGGSLDLQSPLGSNPPVARGEAGEIGGLDPELQGEALLASPRELLEVRGEVHTDLPSGAFTRKFTDEVYQVKVISHVGKDGFNAAMDIRETRKHWLRHLIHEQFGGVDAAFAAHVGKQASYISRIFTDKAEHRRNISENMAREIEAACGLEPGWLDRPIVVANLDRIVRRPTEAVMDGPMEVWDDDTPLPEDEVLVPFLKEVELAAGSGRMSVEVNTKRRLRFGKYSLRNQGVQPENARCVTITGNSMEPVLKNGATVGVDVGNTRVVDGDLYAINHGGQLRVKQAYRLPGGGIRLRSFNRDEHPDEEYSMDDMVKYEIIVIGRVFWGAMFF